jgi:hypothetical protein
MKGVKEYLGGILLQTATVMASQAPKMPIPKKGIPL